MDGLLIDSERAIMAAWIEAARRIGVILKPTDYVRVVGIAPAESRAIVRQLLGGDDAYQEACAIRDLLLTAQYDGTSATPGDAGHSPSAAIPTFPAKPGARELLASLRAGGIPCAVTSSSHHEQIRRRLSSVGLCAAFEAIAGGDEVPRSTPDPAVYLLAARRWG